MLYKINGIQTKAMEIESIAFNDFSHYGKLEKDLEDLIANNLLDKLFENFKIMPIFQERKRQAEADCQVRREFSAFIRRELSGFRQKNYSKPTAPTFRRPFIR